MEQFEIIIPTLLGLEAFTARELRRLGYDALTVEDGRVTFRGDERAVCRANLWLRTGERVLIKIAQFPARSFDELFEQTKAADWSAWIGKTDRFPVKGHSIKSQLASVPDCQSIIKKAIAIALSDKYGLSRLPEEDALYQVQFSIRKDIVTLMIDTSGPALHKRGYRRSSNGAPLRETIAAAMVMMSHWKYELPFADPFCGSGTIPIEAAMIKQNIAPGLMRSFSAEHFSRIPPSLWAECREAAACQQRSLTLEMYVSDINSECIALTAHNARLAGVSDYVRPIQADARTFFCAKPNGTLICNPPYGERMGEIRECEALYRQIGKAFSNLPDWSYYILTSNEQFEQHFGRKATKKRKVYNGMLKCNVYQYFTPKKTKEKQGEATYENRGDDNSSRH